MGLHIIIYTDIENINLKNKNETSVVLVTSSQIILNENCIYPRRLKYGG